jgi:hypothetical protein
MLVEICSGRNPQDIDRSFRLWMEPLRAAGPSAKTSSHPAEKLPPTRKNLRFPELIGPLVVTAPAVLHAIFMNQWCLYLGIAGGIVKQGGATVVSQFNCGGARAAIRF